MSTGNYWQIHSHSFVLSCDISFKSIEGAEEYANAFNVMAESRHDFASTYLFSKIRGVGERYIELFVFRNSESFSQHRKRVSEGTDQMKKAMMQHANLDDVVIRAFGQMSATDRSVLLMMGASVFDYSAGFISPTDTVDADGRHPVAVIRSFKCRSASDADEYSKVFQSVSDQIKYYAPTYLLNKDDFHKHSSTPCVSMVEVLIYHSPKAVAELATLRCIREELTPALERYVDMQSMQVTVIRSSEDSVLDTDPHPNLDTAFGTATFADAKAGYMRSIRGPICQVPESARQVIRQWCRIFSAPERCLGSAEGADKMLLDFFVNRPGLRKSIGEIIARYYNPFTAEPYPQREHKHQVPPGVGQQSCCVVS